MGMEMKRKVTVLSVAPANAGKEKGEGLRVAAYCRVSTSSPRQGESYEEQRSFYERTIRENPGYVLAGIYGDLGSSGGSIKKRAGFQQMLKDCRQGKIDLILTKSISRFARNLSDSLDTIRELRCLGIPVVFDREGINTMEASSEMLLSVLAAVAQEELNSLSQNIKWSLRKGCAEGNPAVRTCYGYRKRQEGKQYVWEVVPQEARRVRLAFQMAEECRKYWEICEALQQLEDEEGTRISWCYEKLRKMLRHEAYVGDLLTGKHVNIDYLDKKEVKNKGFSEQYYLEEHHRAIVTREQFWKVQKNIQEKRLCAGYGEVPLRWKKQFQGNKKETENKGHLSKNTGLQA